MRPLSHLTVVDLTSNLPGPFCSMTLGDLGARVIKVEPPGGDPLRQSAPQMHASLNRGKESIALDLKSSSGREVLHALAKTADVVLEGWRPGVARRLAADYAALSESNPRLVYCSISGFGQEGAWRDKPGHDISYLALSGYLGVQSSIEGRPWPPAILVSDLAAGAYAAISTLAAVSSAQARGEGAYIDLSMTDAVLSLMGPELAGRLAADGRNQGPDIRAIPHYGVFPCAGGGWLSLGIVHEDHFWERFCGAAGLDSIAALSFKERLAQPERIADAVRGALLERSAEEWDRALTEADVPAAVVSSVDDVLAQEHFASRGSIVDVDARRFVSFPARFSSADVAPRRGPPELNEHADALLAELAERGLLKDSKAQVAQ